MSAGELRAQVRLADTALALDDALRVGDADSLARAIGALAQQVGAALLAWGGGVRR